MTFEVQWLRGRSVVGKETSRRVVAGDVSRRLACRVTASNGVGSTRATSRRLLARSAIVRIPVNGGFSVPAGAPPALACRGSMALTMLTGKRILGRRAVSMKPGTRKGRKGPQCLWAWTFRVRRERLGPVRRVKVSQRFAGNAYVDPGAAVKTIAVPRS